MNSRLTQAAYCRTRHHGNSILFFPLRPPVPSITGRLIFPPLLPRHVKIAGRPLASREESHASLMRPRPSHRLQAYVAETPCSSLPCHRSPMGIPLISVFYSIFFFSLSPSPHRRPFFRPISLRVSDRFFLRRFLAAT